MRLSVWSEARSVVSAQVVQYQPEVPASALRLFLPSMPTEVDIHASGFSQHGDGGPSSGMTAVAIMPM